MKEIKFRAWNKNLAIPGSNEFMEYSDKTGLAKFFEIYPKQGVVLNGGAERFIMQCTGLKDKNGKDIYEGDILKIETDKPMVVGWSEKFASFILNKDGWAFSHWFGESCNPKDCEILGNIYENLELI